MKCKHVMLCLTLFCSNINSNNHPESVEELFTRVYKENLWLSKETVSGIGSELRFTHGMRQALAQVIKGLGITSILDAPCGDLNWIRCVDMGECRYIGADIVEELIENNKKKFGPSKEFRHLNLIEDVIDAKVDLIICRDLLAHLTLEQVFTVLKNFKKSGSKYILMTANVETKVNKDSKTGHWRSLNFEVAPFNFVKPLLLIKEDMPFEWEKDKYLGLWRLEDLDI